MEKYSFKDKAAFDDFVGRYCTSSTYYRYEISTPEKFPCVGVSRYTPIGDLGSLHILDTFIYLDDFKE